MSKGVADIGPLDEQLKESRKELAMVKHVGSCQRAKLQEENKLLKHQLQLQGIHKEDRPSILGEQKQWEKPPTYKETLEEQQRKDALLAEIEALTKQLQEKELQAAEEIHSLRQQLHEKEAQPTWPTGQQRPYSVGNLPSHMLCTLKINGCSSRLTTWPKGTLLHFKIIINLWLYVAAAHQRTRLNYYSFICTTWLFQI